MHIGEDQGESARMCMAVKAINLLFFKLFSSVPSQIFFAPKVNISLSDIKIKADFYFDSIKPMGEQIHIVVML